MKVFVTGGTGAIGRLAVPALIAAGHEVTALARTDGKAGQLALLGARPVQVSLFDTAALTAAFAGHDAVVNLATSIPSPLRFAFAKSWRQNARIRSAGSTAVVDAAIAAGVSRLVQESISMTYPDRGADWIDETTPIEVFPITQSTPVAEGNAQRFTDAGGSGVVLRFGLFYGPGSEQSRQMVTFARLHYGLVLGRANGYFSSIHLTDAAAAVVAALSAPAGVYNVVDDEPLTKRAYGDALSAAVGRKAWVRGPGRLSLLAGPNMSSVNRSLRVANRRFREATGWSPHYPSAREGWPASAPALRAGTNPARVVAAIIALIGLVPGIWGTFFPHAFYTSFPGFGRHWVSAEPPYNEHLIRDVGGFYLALGLVALVGAIRGTRPFLVAVGLAAAIEGIPHLVFHLAHAGDLAAGDAAGTAVAIALQIVLGVALVRIAE